MDVVVIGAEDSDRAERFQHYVRGQGHDVQRLLPGAPLPGSDQPLLGVVVFDPGPAHLLDVVRGVAEQVRYQGVALVVVPASKPTAEIREQLRAAGSDVVGEPDTADASIFAELQTRCLAVPTAANIRSELAEPLISAVRQTLTEMVGAESAVRSVHGRTAPATLGDLSATLEISSPSHGSLIVSCSAATAEALAGHVFAEVGVELNPPLIQDCLGEFANVIAGQAKALLAGTPYHFSFSTPTVIVGMQAPMPRENSDCLVIAFDSDVGGFALQLCRPR